MTIAESRQRRSKKRGRKRNHRRPSPHRNALQIESLESRELFAGITLSNGVLEIEGTAASERVVVEYDYRIFSKGGTLINAEVQEYQKGSWTTVSQRSYWTSQVNSIEVSGGDGDDSITNNTGKPMTAYGGNGNDRIYGGTGTDRMFGQSGSDYLRGRDGNDRLYGGNDSDTLNGGNGQDVVSGNSGSDVLYGGNDDDRMYGSSGDDRFYGGNGDDRMYGHSGNDVMYGQQGNDTIYGHSGEDSLFGGTSYSTTAHDGNDTLHGGYDDDVLHGGTGADTMHGGNGDDTLHGGAGGDWMTGGAGDDTMNGEAGNDVLIGEGGNDELRGGSDSDWLYGGDDNDRLFGEGGNDFLYGGKHDDFLSGGFGDDQLNGEDGRDGLFGGQGKDTINGGLHGDRFLAWKTRSIGSFQYDPDDIVAMDISDAKVYFTDSLRTITNDLGVYPPKNWTHEEIERMDQVLSMLHHEGYGTDLVRTATGGFLNFHRHDGGERGYAGNGIHLTDFQLEDPDRFVDDDNWLRGYVLHEIGHYWQGQDPLWDDFKAISGWTDENPNSWNYTKSPEGDWWYRKDARFVSDYASDVGPNDDFAETFAAYFMDRAGWDFYNGNGDIDDVPEKKAILDEMFGRI